MNDDNQENDNTNYSPDNNHNFSIVNKINLEEILKKEIFWEEPNWSLLMFDWMTDKIKELFFKNFKRILTDSNIFFLEGLLHEKGIQNHEQSFERALESYKKGIKLDNQYCLYRLFYILINEDLSEKFNLKTNFELALIFLVKSCAYNESYLDINKIDPIYKLHAITSLINKNMNLITNIIQNYESYSDENLEIRLNEIEKKYLCSFLMLSFPTNVIILKESLVKLEEIADEHMESCFKLACIYYTPMYRDHINKDIKKSLKYFEHLESHNYSRALCSYYKVCEEQKINDKLNTLILQAKKLRGYSSHFYANYICRDRESLYENKNRILKYFFKSLLFGNLISIVIVFEILTKLYIQNLKKVDSDYMNFFLENIEIDLKTFMELILEFVNEKKNNPHIIKTLDYDVLILFYQIHSYFYYKGYIVEKNYEKAIEIMEQTFKDKKSIKCYRKIFYYLAKSYKKLGNMEKFNYFMKKSFDIYILLNEFPYHQFIVAKTFLRGIDGVPKNLDYAIHFFKSGYNYQENNFFINVMYSKKCQNYLIKNEEIINFMNTTSITCAKIIEKFVDSENICIICYSNYKQVRHEKCKHKLICLLCLEKITDKNQCPFCKQKSEVINNEFDIEI